MATCYIKLILLIMFVLLNYNEVDGRTKLSGIKNNVLNTPTVTSLKTRYGDIYDCIDFYKQHAFDHPLLKNHTYNFQVRPSSYPKEQNNNGSPVKANNILDIWSNGRGCPVGTVPIRRTTKQDLVRARKLSKPSSFTPTISGHVHAVVRTKTSNRRYNGVGGAIGLYNPHLGSTNQYSSGQMKLQNGVDSIQVGWTVNPTLYGDNRTRFFTYLNAGQSHCFNTQCPGFVIVNKDIPLGLVFDTISYQGGPSFEEKFSVYRDPTTGDWWLTIGLNDTQIGFWPKRIFTGLGDLASYLEWGGEVYSPPNEPAPYMGSGHPPYGSTRYDAYLCLIKFVNEAHDIVDATDTERFVDSLYYYDVHDWWDDRSNWHHVVTYGGGLWRIEN